MDDDKTIFTSIHWHSHTKMYNYMYTLTFSYKNENIDLNIFSWLCSLLKGSHSESTSKVENTYSRWY